VTRPVVPVVPEEVVPPEVPAEVVAGGGGGGGGQGVTAGALFGELVMGVFK